MLERTESAVLSRRGNAGLELVRGGRGEERDDFAPFQIELLASTNDSNAKRANRKLGAFGDLTGVVKANTAAIDESHPAFADDRPDLTLHYERGVFVNAKSHQRRELGDGHEQSIQSTSLREVW